LTDAATAPVVRSRFVAAGLHLLVSAAVAAVAALLVFTVWYPTPFNLIAGGTALFLILVSVDVVLGPALTLVAASPGKARREFRRDLAVIVAVQLAAFSYGVYTIALARPIFQSFEVDRFRVVTAVDIERNDLDKAPSGIRALPWLGPELIAAVPPTDPGEHLKSIELGMAGIDLSMIPSNWRSYESQKDAVWRAARPIAALIARYPTISADIEKAAAAQRKASAELRYLPLVSRQVSWVVLLAAPDARPIGYLPVDGFI